MLEVNKQPLLAVHNYLYDITVADIDYIVNTSIM